MYQISFGGRASPSGPAEGAYSAPQTPSWIKRSLLLRERDEKRAEGEEGRCERGMEGKWTGRVPPS